MWICAISRWGPLACRSALCIIESTRVPISLRHTRRIHEMHNHSCPKLRLRSHSACVCLFMGRRVPLSASKSSFAARQARPVLCRTASSRAHFPPLLFRLTVRRLGYLATKRSERTRTWRFHSREGRERDRAFAFAPSDRDAAGDEEGARNDGASNGSARGARAKPA